MTEQETAQLNALKVRIFDLSEQLQTTASQNEQFGKALSEIAGLVGVEGKEATLESLIAKVKEAITPAQVPAAAPVAPAVDQPAQAVAPDAQ